MTEQQTYPLELIRSELGRAMAEQELRLLDRFASKHDFAGFRSDFAAHEKHDNLRFDSIEGKLDLLLTEKSERTGASDAQRARGTRWYMLVGAVSTVFAGGLGFAGSLLAQAFFH